MPGGSLAMLVFPVTLVVVLTSTRILYQLFEHQEPLGGSGVAILIAFDVIFLIISWLVFEIVLEA